MVLDIAIIFEFVLPMQMALICCVLLGYMAKLDKSVYKRKIIIIASVAFGLSFFNWLSILFYVTAPLIFVILNSVISLTSLLVNIFFYWFVFELTKTNTKQRFSRLHMVLPVSFFLIMLVWSFFVPFHVQVAMIKSKGTLLEPDYRLFFIFSNSKALLLGLFGIVYSAMGIYRIKQYQRAIVNYSADEYRSSLSWLYLFLFVVFISFFIIFTVNYFNHKQLYHSWFMLVLTVLIMLKDILFTHNVLLENFVVIIPEGEDLNPEEKEQSFIPLSIGYEKVKLLEEYMISNKPYLNPSLKITDMSRSLATNRTSLSLLINSTYGMNFNRFINRYRLNEFYRLKSAPENKDLTELELIVKAGFSDWRGYARVKKREENENI